jgi:hypothetical protein
MAVLLKGRHPAEILTLMVGRVGDDVSDVDPARVAYVGRNSRYGATRWGNPFKLPRGANEVVRASCIDEYTAWIQAPEQAELLEAAKRELRGKVLLCHCQHRGEDSPACHAEVLVRLVNPAIVTALKAAPRKRDMRYASHFKTWAAGHGLEQNPVVLVTGNRSFESHDAVEALLRLQPEGTIVVQGEAQGADSLAADVALELGMPLAGFPASWEVTAYTPTHRIKHGPRGAYDSAAGFIRNQRMLDAVLAHAGEAVCAAFTDDIERRSGTRDMATRAYLAGMWLLVSDAEGTITRHHVPPTQPPAEAQADVLVEGPAPVEA